MQFGALVAGPHQLALEQRLLAAQAARGFAMTTLQCADLRTPIGFGPASGLKFTVQLADLVVPFDQKPALLSQSRLDLLEPPVDRFGLRRLREQRTLEFRRVGA